MVREAVTAAGTEPQRCTIRPMGGVQAALHQMAFASRVRLDVDLDRITVSSRLAATS